MRGKPIDHTTAKAIADALKRGVPVGVIADQYGISRRTVSGIATRYLGPALHRGRRPRLDDETKLEARSRYLRGEPPWLIAKALGRCVDSIHRWARDYGWKEELARIRQTPDALLEEIARATALLAHAKGKDADRLAKRIRMLQKAHAGLLRTCPRPKDIPRVHHAQHAELLARAIADDYGLLPYQRAFLMDDARYRCVLKARQIGFTYIIGLSVVLGLAAGRDQVIVSASEDQAKLVMAHVRGHAEKLGLEIADDTDRAIRINGSTATALSTNWRTAQGYTGDVWFDEFAWAPRPDALWGAIVPAITRVGGRITVCSTPWVPGNLFWKIATNYQGKWAHFTRTRITIHDAIAQGMPVPGGLEELRLNFDAATWMMFYECQWAEEEGALLSWALLDALAGDLPAPTGKRRGEAPRFGRVRIGIDLGRVADRTVIVVVGEAMDPVADAFTGHFRVLHWESLHGADFATQRAAIEAAMARWLPERVDIDRTGLGWQLAEELAKAHPGVVVPRSFSAPMKERLALGLLRLAEQKRLSIPRDATFMASLHAVRRLPAGQSIKYDAPRDASGHGDAFWALALALDGVTPVSRNTEIELWG
jgi:phage FluMu gp28-like protein